MTEQLARAVILDLLAQRAAGVTICPSEAARILGGAQWRAAMDVVHAAAAGLAGEGRVQLSQRGEPVVRPVGAYRIGRRPLPARR